MTVKTYSVSKQGETKLSSNFKVKQFQKYVGIKSDGIVGVNTWTKMFS